MSVRSHKKNAPKRLNIAVVTVSTSRSKAEDKSGKWIRRRAEKEGHRVVFHEVIPDSSHAILKTITSVINEFTPHVILINGGTGISKDDVTIETVRPLFDKELTGFGALFAQLSYEEIDSAAILSRATAGIINTSILFCMPGSLNACKLACKALIFPEVGHLAKHLTHK